MFTTRYALDPGEQKLLDLTFETRRRGSCFRPGQNTLARWLNRSPRQVQRYLTHLRELSLLFWKRPGKKLTNVYYVGAALWRTLMKGRKLPGVSNREQKNGQVSREEARRLLADIVADLGKRNGRPPDTPA
jgi:hypothetical protein